MTQATEHWNPVVGRWEPLPAWRQARVTPTPAAPAAPAIDANAAGRAATPTVTHQRPVVAASRAYHSARSSRATSGWYAAETSADAELASSLRVLRSRSRQLVRDAAYAKRAKVVVVNNVIGAGVGLQAQVVSTRGRSLRKENAAIEAAWKRWGEARYCHTGGKMHFPDLERAAFGQIFEAGECLFRKHYRAFGGSPVPFALEFIEPERLADHYSLPNAPNGNEVRMGVEVDSYDRPVAYWLRERHPGDVRGRVRGTEKLIRVPAEQMWHLYVVDRWPQSRGEPWLHATARRLNDMDAYSEAEIIAARNSACQMGFIETPLDQANTKTMVDETNADTGEQIREMAPGIIDYLAPGQKFTEHNPSRPNTAIDPFLRYMLREVAAGTGVSYESLSRDYSKSNYSSSRLALLEDRDLWRSLQLWWLRNFRVPLHREWLKFAVYAGAVKGIDVDKYLADPERFEAAKFKPRGWSWIDPKNEVQYAMASVRSGFTTVGDVISKTGDGRDLEEVLEERKAELELMREHGLVFDTDPAVPKAGAAAPAEPAADDADDTDAEDDDPADDDSTDPDAQESARVFSLR